MRGRQKCKILKEIRQRIADENDIPYVTRECSYQGECTGTCPRCESELRYLEQQLELRRSLGKRVSVAALCVGMALASAGCSPTVRQPTESMQTDLTGEVGPDESNLGDSGGVAVEPGSDIEEPEPEYIELSGDVAYPDGYDSAGSEDVMVTLEGEVAWPEA